MLGLGQDTFLYENTTLDDLINSDDRIT